MRTQLGVSLIEALATLTLVLVGLTGAARLQIGLLAAGAEAKARDEATALALDTLAAFHAVTSHAAYRQVIVPGSRRQNGRLHTYQLTWTVEHHPDPDYKRVDLQVDWPADAPAHRVYLQTLIPGHDPARFAHLQLTP
ncbi:MAG: hypothetical protein ABR553_01910 [Gammaproteobacteria bacterium]